MKRCYIVLSIILLNITMAGAQKMIDLSHLKFTEKADELLKSIPNEKRADKDAVHYEIKDPKNCPLNGIVMESGITVGAFKQVVTSYTAETNFTVNTNRVIKTMLAQYRQPTKKITNNGDVRAWYWQTPTLFIQLMTAEVGFHDKRGKQISCTVKVVTLKGLKSGAEPDLASVYQVFSTYKI